MGGSAGRVPLIKLNFNHCQSHTQIPASQSANLRQMILFELCCHTGRGNSLDSRKKKKRACKLFPSCFKVPNNRKRFVFMCGVSVSSLSPLVSAGFYSARASVNSTRDLLLSAHVQQSGRQNTKGCRLSFSWINKTVQGSFKPGGSCCVTLFSRRRFDQSRLQDLFPLLSPPTRHPPSLPHPTLQPPKPTSALLLLINGGLLTANSNWLGSTGLVGEGRMEGKVQPISSSRSLPFPSPPDRTPFLMLLGISHGGNCKYLAHLVRLPRASVAVSTNRKTCVSENGRICLRETRRWNGSIRDVLTCLLNRELNILGWVCLFL